MAIVPKQLVAPQQLTNAAATYITGVTIKTRIDKVTLCNPTGTARTVTIYIIPVGQAAGDAYTLTKAYAIPGNTTWNCPDLVGQIMAAGDFLQALASANTAITMMISGTEISP